MDYKKITEDMLKFWQENKSFEQSVKNRKLDYRFYDWPPFASWDPHYWHMLASTIKDIVPRYWTMRGYKVERIWWWDCHGLPVENQIEKKLWITSKSQIEEEVWIKKFTDECRKFVLDVNENWERFVNHVGRWVDFDNAYFTMNTDFMESVMNVFSSLYKNSYIFKGFKVQWYCPRCATTLSNHEINEWYADKQDQALTVKFQLNNTVNDKYETTDDGFQQVVCAVVKNDNKYLMMYHNIQNIWMFAWGKVEKWESLEDALKREIQEELGVQTQNINYLSSIKIIHNYMTSVVNYFFVDLSWQPIIQENDKHTELKWVEKISTDNALWFAVKVDNIIIEDENQLYKDFTDFVLFDKFDTVLKGKSEQLKNADFNFLAWTTTPWTLPSNMFLAVWVDIDYTIIFDLNENCYFVLADNLLSKYYKNTEDYVLIYRLKGKELINIWYKPLFDFYRSKADIDKIYKDNVFKVLPWDFVSTNDGTGIVHIAPAFGADDYELVCSYWEFKKDKVNQWLFLPIDEYGKFTSDAPQYSWQWVFDVNKQVIQDLKSQNKVVKIETINHSYPYCRRCDTPLIYRAIDSWFVDEISNKQKILDEAKDLHFVPEYIKTRFDNILSSAPDWNISRKRYWWAPLPVWESESGKRQILGSIDELYKYSKTGSKNLSKFLFVRHWETDYNIKKYADSYGKAVLNDNWKQQAEALIRQIWQKLSNFDKAILIPWFEAEGEELNLFIVELKAKLEKLWIEVHIPNMPNISHPKLAEWRAYFVQNFANLIDEKTLLLGHSLWGLFVWDVIKNLNHKVWAIFVAPVLSSFDFEKIKASDWYKVQKSDFDALFNFISSCKYSFDDIKNNLKDFKVLLSDNDRYIEQDKVKAFFSEENIIILSSKWHFGPKKDLDKDMWKEIREVLFDENKVYLSPLQRCVQTITPFIKEMYGIDLFEIKDYAEIKNRYEDFVENQNPLDYEDRAKHIYKIWENIVFDFRLAEIYLEKLQDMPVDRSKLTYDDNVLCDGGESVKKVFERVSKAIVEIGNENIGKTNIICSHGDPLVLMIKTLYDFDYSKRKMYFYPQKWEIKTYYFDKNIWIWIDLHRPHIDKIWFELAGEKYTRITDVLDCWFESGSMPYGEIHYPFHQNRAFNYPADFIAEWLDQTRWWFRALHVLGSLLQGKKAFKNVVVNWLILAEDGKKMSKKLRNFPDPKLLLDQYGADSFRLYVINSPVVRSEPMRFTEKWVEQVMKDFSIPLQNVYNFFETYAKIDNFKASWNNIYFINKYDLNDKNFIEKLIRLDLDEIYWNYSDLLNKIQEFSNKSIKTKEIKSYDEILAENKNKNILILWDKIYLNKVWNTYYDSAQTLESANNEIIKLPNYKIINELDKWILAECYKTLDEVDKYMNIYYLDTATKSMMDFVDKLTNWYLRRSRRRFWEEGMSADKISAYNTLFEVLQTYMKIASPFAPFISEYIWLKLNDFIEIKKSKTSVHLEYRPIFTNKYIDQKLIDEIETVRKIIKLALYVRAKNKIKVKQPLKNLEIKL